MGKQIRPGMAIHCKDRDERAALLARLRDAGYTWQDGKEIIGGRMYDGDSTVYCVSGDGTVRSSSWGYAAHEGWEITEFPGLDLGAGIEAVTPGRGEGKGGDAEPPHGKKIRIKYFSGDIERLAYIGGKSDWIDLRASEDVKLEAGDFSLIPLGVAMELPEGYEAHIVPRSSTFKNYGILQTNSCGIIDQSYCGDDDMWKMPVYATRDTVIYKNDRICQFRIVENQPRVRFEEVQSLGNGSRGGFGSTGKS